eukprot:270044_1
MFHRCKDGINSFSIISRIVFDKNKKRSLNNMTDKTITRKWTQCRTHYKNRDMDLRYTNSFKQSTKHGPSYGLLVSNCCNKQLNGLYVKDGSKNGYTQYVHFVDKQTTIYCNPKRGWNICCKGGVDYYSYPLTLHPPTVLECDNFDVSWFSQGIDDITLPNIRSYSKDDILDFLFVGFTASNKREIHWYMIPIDIVRMFCDYYNTIHERKKKSRQNSFESFRDYLDP